MKGVLKEFGKHIHENKIPEKKHKLKLFKIYLNLQSYLSLGRIQYDIKLLQVNIGYFPHRNKQWSLQFSSQL